MAVHRFKAGDSKEVSEKKSSKTPAAKRTSAAKTVEKPKKEAAVRRNEEGAPRKNPFRRLAEYFKGSWVELRQVRWPNRKQTWQLTFAVVVFSLLVGVLIFGLDALFTWLFKEIIL